MRRRSKEGREPFKARRRRNCSQRRHFLRASLALAVASALRAPPARGAPMRRVLPSTPGWPADADWAELKQTTNGRLSSVTLPKL
jgi:hypothetical protein